MITIKTIGSSSSGNCYHISDGQTPILLEAGIRLQKVKQAIGFKISNVNGCLLSHFHGDHVAAVKDIIKAGIDCYMSRETAEHLKLSSHRLKIIESEKQFQLGSWTILPFDTIHCPGSLGFLIVSGDEKILFLTDASYIEYCFDGLTRIMIECNYITEILQENIDRGLIPQSLGKRIFATHFSLKNVVGLLRANDLSQLKEVHLLHLSNDNSNAEIMLDEVRRLVGVPVYIAGGV